MNAQAIVTQSARSQSHFAARTLIGLTTLFIGFSVSVASAEPTKKTNRKSAAVALKVSKAQARNKQTHPPRAQLRIKAETTANRRFASTRSLEARPYSASSFRDRTAGFPSSSTSWKSAVH